MTIAERVERDLGLTVTLWDGAVTYDDTVQHLVRLAEHRHFPPGRLHLTDIRTATTVTLPDAELLEILFEDTGLRHQDLTKVVIVPPSSLRRGGVKDEAVKLGFDAAVFADVGRGAAHLGIDPDIVHVILRDLRADIARSAGTAVAAP